MSRVQIRNSKAMLSAHPMSHLLDFQFLCSLHAHHLFLMMIARPQLVLALEKAL